MAITLQVKPWLIFFEAKIGEFSLFFTTFATILFCLNRRSFYLFDFQFLSKIYWDLGGEAV